MYYRKVGGAAGLAERLLACNSPNLDSVQRVARRPVDGHLAHDEHHDLGPLVVGQVSAEESCQGARKVRQLRAWGDGKTAKCVPMV